MSSLPSLHYTPPSMGLCHQPICVLHHTLIEPASPRRWTVALARALGMIAGFSAVVVLLLALLPDPARPGTAELAPPSAIARPLRVEALEGPRRIGRAVRKRAGWALLQPLLKAAGIR